MTRAITIRACATLLTDCCKGVYSQMSFVIQSFLALENAGNILDGKYEVTFDVDEIDYLLNSIASAY